MRDIFVRVDGRRGGESREYQCLLRQASCGLKIDVIGSESQ